MFNVSVINWFPQLRNQSIWMQLGIYNEDADRCCVMEEQERLFDEEEIQLSEIYGVILSRRSIRLL